MKKIIITWFNSIDKATLFCEWVAKNYKHRTATIEKDNDSECHWIYLNIKEEDASTFQIVGRGKIGQKNCPTKTKSWQR